jgi:ribonuclease D
VAEGDLPILRRPAKPRQTPAVERRIAALLAWRAAAAPRVGLDPGLLLPRRLIEPLAQRAPADLPALEAIDGMRRWRVAEFGSEILAALSGGGISTGPRPAARDSSPGGGRG